MRETAGRESLILLAPLSGVVVPLERVPDPAFADRLVGDGVSIDPLSDRVLAPCAARVLQMHRAQHAVTLSAAGLEIIIHVGLDTVALRGEGFSACVKAGDEVGAGDTLLAFDADFVARRARSLLTQVLVTNTDRIGSMSFGSGTVAAGRDLLMRIVLASDRAVARADEPVARIESVPIVVAAVDGLHARPAAMLVALARHFTADLRLVKDGREANVRSLVSIMALEVAHGDRVTLVARGADAQAAVDALATALVSGLVHASAGAVDTGTARARRLRTMPEVPDAATAHGPPDAEVHTSVGATAGVHGCLIGVAASPGVAIGRIFQFRHEDTVPDVRSADPNHERRALEQALAAAHLQLDALRVRLAADADDDKAAIFAAHQELLEDPEVLDRAAAEIRTGASAAWAWREAYSSQADRLLALRTTLLAGRATDLRDVGRRVLYLLTGHGGSVRAIPPESIVVAEELAPSEAASLDRTRVRGFCTTTGSATSHAAIIARGLGIPAVCGIDPRALDLADGLRVVLDGDAGTLRPGPTAPEEAEVERRQRLERRRRDSDLAEAAAPATTLDGHRVEVAANVGDVEDAARVAAQGGEAIGLLRTEFLFMDRRDAPDEDEQTRTYDAIVRAVGPECLVVMRTLDVGGDKPLPYLALPVEANPFLGERGVRLTLNRPALFRQQIRAILRASIAGRVAIMFPMISTVAEWRAARAMVEAERTALALPPIPIGIMVETAAAALLAELFAREADFLSIGTNDLTQYTLAMDRTNPRLAPQIDALHPAVLQLIERTVAGAHAHGRWVGVCGALASDHAAVPVLIGLGVDELSVDVPLVAMIKARVRALRLDDCVGTARIALAAADGGEVRAAVRERHP